MGFNSSAVIASVLGSLLVVGIVLVVTNSNDVNAPAQTQQTELMWGDNSAPIPGLVDGWNTSVGTAAEREAAARHYHVTIADDDSLWKHNVFTPFAGNYKSCILNCLHQCELSAPYNSIKLLTKPRLDSAPWFKTT